VELEDKAEDKSVMIKKEGDWILDPIAFEKI
jgi:hypothetical protein